MFFIKAIIVIICIYFLGKLIIRGILSYFLGDVTQKMNDRVRSQQDEFARHKKKKEGHVTINYRPKTSKNFQKDDGDYVEFEEVK